LILSSQSDAKDFYVSRNSSAFGFLLRASSQANIAKPNKVRHAMDLMLLNRYVFLRGLYKP
jgi:hypothetical protein